MQYTYGIFESEADHLIELVRHAPLDQVRAAGCPVCGSAITITFAEDGSGLSIACEGKALHVTVQQDVADPPPPWTPITSPISQRALGASSHRR